MIKKWECHDRKYKDYVYRKMLVQEYLKKWRIFLTESHKQEMQQIYFLNNLSSILITVWFFVDDNDNNHDNVSKQYAYIIT